MDRQPFIHSSVDGHLGCFHLLAAISNAAINIQGTHKFLLRHICSCLLHEYLEEELLGPRAMLCLTLWGTIKVFQSGCTISIPTSSISGSNLSTSSSPCAIITLFNPSSPSGCGLTAPNCGWICVSLMTHDAEHFFQFLIGHLYICYCSITKSCPTFCDPMDCSPPNSSVYRILQARIQEWAISSSRGLPDPGTEPGSAVLQGDSLPSEPPRRYPNWMVCLLIVEYESSYTCWKQEKGTTKDEMAGWHHQLYGHKSQQALGVGDGQGSLACCSQWGHKKADTTEWLNWTDW